jgi:hypothetical protein
MVGVRVLYCDSGTCTCFVLFQWYMSMFCIVIVLRVDILYFVSSMREILKSTGLESRRGKMCANSFIDSISDPSGRLTGAVYPLDIEDRRYYHPSSRAQWERVPGRPTAWRLHPYSYMWVPSSELFPAVGHSHTGSFPREFTLLVTLRIHPQVRSESSYTLEFFQFM